jgi:para-nitrobenzyl esterase
MIGSAAQHFAYPTPIRSLSRRSIILRYFFYFSVALSLRAADVVATTSAGQIRGRKVNGVFVFKGVPYGADTAKRRFQSPALPVPWTGIRDCIEFGPIAPQPEGTSTRSFRHADLPQSEDCLNLNLWTPALHDSKRRPVFVYFHGGGYDSQTGDLIDGEKLSGNGDAVVVAVNHRLGGFGFLYLGDVGGNEFSFSANVGLLDLILALKWVQANITEFGGDPKRVTIFGESGGAGKCLLLMTAPAAKGLFQRVWTMSGSAVGGVPRESAAVSAQWILADLKIESQDLGKLQTLPMGKLIAAFGGKRFAPVADGSVLPRDSFQPDPDVPLVLGTTHDEMSPFPLKDPRIAQQSTWDDAIRALPAGVPNPSQTIAAYRRMYPEYTPAEVVHATASAWEIWRGIVAVSERRAKQRSATWVYCLEWPGRDKASHAIDLGLVLNDPKENWRTAQQPTGPAMARIMSDSFLAFGRTGDPNAPSLPKWPQFKLPERTTMIFDLPPRVENDPRRGERELLFPPRAMSHR